jgi:hypothetical protein
MKKNNISKYCKLATVLLFDAIPVWFTISLSINGSDTDFMGFWLMIIYLFFLVFNVWALIIYYLTKQIKKLWLRDILFYLLLFLYLSIPFFLILAT